METLILQSPLPDPEAVVSNAIDDAWVEVGAWGAAATGILLVVLILKSFRGA
jgi:hypothetical protein